MAQPIAFAHGKIPTEVWHDILEHILHSLVQFSLDTNPIQPGVNVPAFLRRWDAPSWIHSLLNQRMKLLLVCKAWNNLVGRMALPYIRLDQAYIYNWPEYYIYEAKRIKADIYQPTCECTGKCACHLQPYNDGSIFSLWRRALRSGNSFSAEILTFQNSELGAFLDASSKFPQLRALTVIKGLDNVPRLAPTAQSAGIFSKLVYLHIIIHLEGQLFSSSDHLTFPNLTTLRYSIRCSQGELLERILGRQHSMPKLQHLSISTERLVRTGYLNDYIQLLGKGLLSLSIKSPSFRIMSPDFWADFPFLTSLATVVDYDPLPVPPPSSCLEVFVNTGSSSPPTIYNLQLLVEEYQGLKMVGSSHNWNNMNNYQRLHLLRLAELCNERGIRFEDSVGRTLEESKNEIL